MAFKRRRIEGLLSSATATLGDVGLGAAYGRVFGIVARNWASSAKAGAGTDTAVKIKLQDGNGDIFYLDASDRDYATAEVTLNIMPDDTATGLGVTPVDATGAAATAGGGVNPIVKSPVTVIVLNGGTATDFMTVDLLVEV
jgi:hypothetical protein